MAVHMREKDIGNWKHFEKYCLETGISLEHHDDWFPWWECWNAAMDAVDEVEFGNFPTV